MENWTREDSVAAMEAWYRRGGGRGRTVVWLVGLPLLVGLIFVGAYVVSQSKLDWNLPSSLQNLTAGVLGQPSPSPKPTLGAPARLPPGTVPSTSPGASDPATLFAAFIADAHQSYHVETTATAKQNGQTLTITMSVDESGPDFAGTMSISGGNRNSSDRFVVKNGAAYVKAAGQGWVATSNLAALDLPNGGITFASIESDKIQFLGRESHEGQSLNHLQALTASAAGLVNPAGCQATDLPWDIWVRDDGQPVSATFDYSCTVAGSTASATASYEFTRVGRPIDIVAPEQYTQN